MPGTRNSHTAKANIQEVSFVLGFDVELVNNDGVGLLIGFIP
jgi:hypothetical protein